MEQERAIEQVVERIERDRDRLVDTVRELVRIPTVNPKFEEGEGINRERDAQELVGDLLAAAGMTVTSAEPMPGRPNVVGRLDGGSDRSLVINGHIDVVPAGDLADWETGPFEAAVRGGRIYGRGTYDMKAGLGAAIGAVQALSACGVPLAGRLDVHSVVDEEAGGFGTRALIDDGHSGSAVIVAEPTQNDIMLCQPGLEWVRVTLRGLSAHAGWRYNDIYPQRDAPDRPRPGVNAAELAARFITAVGHLERSWGMRKSHPLLPPGITTISPGVVHVGVGMGEDGLPVSVTNPATTPDVATVDFDLKYLPTETSAAIRREFEEFVHHWAMQDPWLREHPPRVQWELHGLHFPEFDTPPEHPLVASIVRQSTRLGLPGRITGFPAVCDGAFYRAAGADPIIFGPRGADAHGPDEWVDIDSIVDVAKVMAVAAVEYCGLAT
jgi:acetylornithine deacetylase/succinyl-diaminopimelate desuccinylase family protein